MNDKSDRDLPIDTYSKRIKLASWSFAIVATVIAIAAYVVLWILPNGNEQGRPKSIGGLLALPVGGYLVGMSLAVLFAPTSYLLSEEGKKWKAMVGTKSVRSTRIVAFIFAALGIAFFTFLVLALLTNDFKRSLF